MIEEVAVAAAMTTAAEVKYSRYRSIQLMGEAFSFIPFMMFDDKQPLGGFATNIFEIHQFKPTEIWWVFLLFSSFSCHYNNSTGFRF